MGTSYIDGTIESAALKRKRRNIAIFDHIRFKLADGSNRTVGKSVAAGEIADRLQPGASGRFYLYTSIDHKGVHGVRDGQGKAVYGFPTTNETLMLVVVGINLAWLIAAVTLGGVIPILPTLLVVLGIPAWFLYRKTRLETRRQFDADNGA